MTKTTSGLTLIAVGVGLNIAGRLVLRLHPAAPSLLILAGSQAILMISSVVVALFGLFRLAVGSMSRKKPAEACANPAVDETIWPPAPKPPEDS